MGAISTDVKPATHRVSLQGSTIQIGHLELSLDDAVEYMRGIPAEKRELAFVHAVQVGMAEIIARRRRFHMDRQSAAAAGVPAPKAVTVASTPIPATIVHDRQETLAPVTEASVEIVAEEEKVVQPRISPPLEPRMDTAEEHSSENRPNRVRPQPEPDGWLRRLDEDFEILDQV